MNFFDHIHQILTYDVIFAPKMTQFGPFSPKMTYFDQIDPINGNFHQIYVHKSDGSNFYKLLEIFGPFLQDFTYDVILAPKMTQFWPFSQKMTYFDPIDPINDIFDQIYVHKPYWNNFEKLLRKKIFIHFPEILKYDVILTHKVTQFWPN